MPDPDRTRPVVSTAHTLLMAITAFIALLFLHCYGNEPKALTSSGAPPAPQASPQAWERAAARVVESGDCASAKGYLAEHQAHEPLWYEFMSQAHMKCWGGSHRRADFESAIRILDDGLHEFPRAANLLLSKGYRYREVGESDLATQNFEDAKARAQKNLEDESSASAADRSLIEAATKEIAQQRDPSVAQNRFEQAILLLIADGDCAGAISALRGASRDRQTDGWFDLLYVSNHNCFVKTGDAAYERSGQTALAEGLQAFPASPRLLLESAALREQSRDLRGAVKLYEAALKSPDFDKTFPGGRAATEERVRTLKASAK